LNNPSNSAGPIQNKKKKKKGKPNKIFTTDNTDFNFYAEQSLKRKVSATGNRT